MLTTVPTKIENFGGEFCFEKYEAIKRKDDLINKRFTPAVDTYINKLSHVDS